MNAKERKRILGYDVEALRRDISKYRENIKTFSATIDNAKVRISKYENDVKTFSGAIEDARNQIGILEGYVKIIKEEEAKKNGNCV